MVSKPSGSSPTRLLLIGKQDAGKEGRGKEGQTKSNPTIGGADCQTLGYFQSVPDLLHSKKSIPDRLSV
jgi:hypothetical protein